MSHYKHLTPEEREKILLLLSKNYSITYIAAAIGRNKSTVSRELSRNSIAGMYSAISAQATYHKRRRNCHAKHKLSDPDIFQYVRDKFLEHQWSPEQIAGRLKIENTNITISYSTIYRSLIRRNSADPKVIVEQYANSGIVEKPAIQRIILKNAEKSWLVTILKTDLLRLKSVVALVTGKEIPWLVRKMPLVW